MKKNPGVGGVVRSRRALTSCVLALCALASFCACGRASVPSLRVASFTTPALASLTPRELDVAVRDERLVPAEDRRATEQHLVEFLEQLLRGARVSLSPQAPHRLEIAVRHPERTGTIIQPSSCIELRWELKLHRVISASNTSVGCSEWRNAEGASMPDVTAAFHQAVEMQLAHLDGTAAELARLSPELAFDAADIEVPSFAWLKPRALALQVADELSADGALGKALRSAAEAAFARADVRVIQEANYRLALKLARPAPANTEMERRVCVALSADLSGPSGRRFASREECPRRDEPLGKRLVNGVLLGLDSH